MGDNLSEVCYHLLKEWVYSDEDNVKRSAYYAGQKAKRVGFRVEPTLKRLAVKKAGWQNLGVVMSNLVKIHLEN